MSDNSKRDEVLAASLTAEDTGLLPFLPYLLQDFWELGADPEMTADLLRENLPAGELQGLDLACGKGAVSVKLAQKLGWRMRGVDLIPEFIEVAREKAEEFGVAGLCTFEVGDANEAVAAARGYDCVLFAAAGNVLGAPQEMLQKLAGATRPGGWLVVDESYLPDDAAPADIQYLNYAYHTCAQWQEMFAAAGLRVVARASVPDEALEEGWYDEELGAIRRRAAELSARHPDKTSLFEGYVKSQEAEVFDIENSLVNVVWLLQKTE